MHCIRYMYIELIITGLLRSDLYCTLFFLLIDIPLLSVHANETLLQSVWHMVLTSPFTLLVQGDVWEVYHDIASYLLQSTSENVLGKKRHRLRRKHSSHVYRTISQVIEVLHREYRYPPPPLLKESRKYAMTDKAN